MSPSCTPIRRDGARVAGRGSNLSRRFLGNRNPSALIALLPVVLSETKWKVPDDAVLRVGTRLVCAMPLWSTVWSR